MRRITIVLLIFLVLGILAGVIFISYRGSDIVYVCDYKDNASSDLTSSTILKRLYSSGIDEASVQELSTTLLTTAFTEDELLEAALKAGKPEFYPWFSFQISRSPNANNVVLEGKVGQTLFEDQDSSRYTVTNLKMEMTTDTSPINADKTVMYGCVNNTGLVTRVVPVVAGDGSSLAVLMDKFGAYDVEIDGFTGTLMVQYTFDIVTTDQLFNHTVLSDQLVQIYITMNGNDQGGVDASFEIVDASQVSDVY